jgi:hypothetical protein
MEFVLANPKKSSSQEISSAFLILAFQRLKLVRRPRSLAPTLVALPSMSLIPRAPFSFQLLLNASTPQHLDNSTLLSAAECQMFRSDPAFSSLVPSFPCQTH